MVGGFEKCVIQGIKMGFGQVKSASGIQFDSARHVGDVAAGDVGCELSSGGKDGLVSGVLIGEWPCTELPKDGSGRQGRRSEWKEAGIRRPFEEIIGDGDVGGR